MRTAEISSLAEVDPRARPHFERVVARAEAEGLGLHVYETRRTLARQKRLKAKGVSNASTYAESPHVGMVRRLTLADGTPYEEDTRIGAVAFDVINADLVEGFEDRGPWFIGLDETRRHVIHPPTWERWERWVELVHAEPMLETGADFGKGSRLTGWDTFHVQMARVLWDVRYGDGALKRPPEGTSIADAVALATAGYLIFG